MEKVRTIHKSENSYTIKHYFEYSGKGFYVTNGAMKEALVLSGFEILDRRQQNYQVNVSKRCVNKLFKEMCMVH
ncbi:hypothetical protein [Corticicoccus populi]|uniref:Uncharacterized protein n=1 Tax=Corticicoccus populi TaxID=1812821 RepID=A0ABW5WWD3_9STAP